MKNGFQGRGVENAPCPGFQWFPSRLVDSGFGALSQRAEANCQQAPKQLCGFFLTPGELALLLRLFGPLLHAFSQQALYPLGLAGYDALRSRRKVRRTAEMRV